jgi:hypothetical protein
VIYNITVKGTKEKVEVDSGKISDELCAYIFQKGLDSLLGRGRSKLGKPADHASVEAFTKEAVAIAERQVSDLYEGKTRMVGGGQKKAKGADAAVQTEMLRVAKLYAKEQVKAAGKIKISKVSAAEWTRAAKAYIEAEPEYFRKVAEANLAAASEVKPAAAIDLSFIKEDPKKAKAAEQAAAKKKAEAKVSKPPVKAKAKPAAHASN